MLCFDRKPKYRTLEDPSNTSTRIHLLCPLDVRRMNIPWAWLAWGLLVVCFLQSIIIWSQSTSTETIDSVRNFNFQEKSDIKLNCRDSQV